MEQVEQKRILVVGGGLAGAFLSARLVMRGHNVLMLDKGAEERASNVAAGLYNVVTGRFASKTWLAEELLQALHEFFAQPEFAELKDLLHPLEIYRPFRDAGDANDWLGKANQEKFAGIVRLEAEPRLPKQIENPHGGLVILPCGWGDTRLLLKKLPELLARTGDFELREMALEYAAVDAKKMTVSLAGKSEKFDQIVFCDGLGSMQNPLFSWLPLRPLKGQVLDLEIPDYQPGFVLSKKVFLLPLPDGRFRVGSTYEKDFSDSSPTPEGRAEIEEHLGKALKMPWKVVDQRAGIRPTTPNRRPMLGPHPEHEQCFVFNGLGTKGWLQAPYFSKMMLKCMEEGKNSLIKDVDITRYLK